MRNKQPLFSTVLVFFTRGHERSIKAKQNILISFLIRGFSIAISIVLVPITINYVNPTKYGIWLTLSSIVAWFGFFDIGFGNGMRNRFAEAIANGEQQKARIYVSTTYAILSIIVLIVLLLFFAINPLLDWSKILNTPPEMADELKLLALIVFVFFCLQFVLQLLTTVITANQQPAKASLFNLIGSIISLTVIFVLTKTTSGSLLYLGAVFSSAPVLVLAVSSFWLYRSTYREYAPSTKFVQFRYARNLMSLGLKFFVLQVAAVILYETSNIIIAQLFGPSQVTPYNIAYKYFSLVPMVLGIIMIPFWSAFTEAWVKQDLAWIKHTMRNLIYMWAGFTVLAVIMLVFSDFVYGIWVGKAVEVSWSISIVMTAYVVINGWCGIFSQFLNGVGKIKLQLYSSLFGALVNIPLAIFLGKQLGVAGVVLSTCLIGLISAVWSPIQYTKLINSRATGIWNQ